MDFHSGLTGAHKHEQRKKNDHCKKRCKKAPKQLAARFLLGFFFLQLFCHGQNDIMNNGANMDSSTRWKELTKGLEYTESFECPKCHMGVLHYTTIEPYPEGLDEQGRKNYRRMTIDQCGTCKTKFIRPYD